MEKLVIKNFAGLKRVSLEISPVTGLIGPQASGKSVTAKLLYFFREIASRLPQAVINEGLDAAKYKAKCCQRFNRYFPIENDGSSDFEITYSSKNEQVRVIFNKEENEERRTVGLAWTDFYPKAVEKIAQRKEKLLSAVVETDKDGVANAQRALRDEFYDEAAQVLGEWSKFEQIFIPAGRAFFRR